MRFLAWCLRTLGVLVLAAGAVLAVGDVARSLASGNVRLLSISETMALTGLNGAAAEQPRADPVFTGGDRGRLVAELGRQPASIVLGLVGIAFIAAGSAPRARRPGEPPRKV